MTAKASLRAHPWQAADRDDAASAVRRDLHAIARIIGRQETDGGARIHLFAW